VGISLFRQLALVFTRPSSAFIVCILELMIGLKSTLNVRDNMLARYTNYLTTSLQVIDNSGAVLIECVNVLKQKVNNGWGSVGDEIVCVVKSARPLTATAAASVTAVKVRRGDVRRAVIVRTRKPVRRPDGRLIRFDDNAAVLLNNKREMLGTRIGGVVSADLRMKGWGKIMSLAPKVHIVLDIFAGKQMTDVVLQII
jgi:ribosomal protein L14